METWYRSVTTFIYGRINDVLIANNTIGKTI